MCDFPYAAFYHPPTTSQQPPSRTALAPTTTENVAAQLNVPVNPHAEKTHDPTGTNAENVDWTCRGCSQQSNVNLGDCTLPASFNFCSACGESRSGEPNHMVACAPPTGDWSCSACDEVFPESFKWCVECGRPAGAPPPPPKDTCGGCDEPLAPSFHFCPDCGIAAGQWRDPAIQRFSFGPSDRDWPCGQCRTDVPGAFRFCSECGSGQPSRPSR